MAKVGIPVYSIGAGIDATFQLMICRDLLGIFQAFMPIAPFIECVKEARGGEFLEDEHGYKMIDGELNKLLK